MLKRRKNQTPSGKKSPHSAFADQNFLRNVYLSKNEEIIGLFRENLRAPDISIFKSGDDIPTFITEARQAADATVIRVVEKKGLDTTQNAAITIQREVRYRQRQKEYQALVGANSNNNLQETLIDAANQPYKPIGIPESNIVDRIMKIIEKPDFKLFDTVGHLTTDSACTSILNDALYGQKTLKQLSKPFKPAALHHFDIENGDVNVICCGPYRIDSICIKPETTQFIFDVEKLSVKNAFFKQLDMGFYDKKQHSILIAENTDKAYELKFSLNSTSKDKQVELQLFDDEEDDECITKLPRNLFISHNVKDMHKILTLNFFRFLDSMPSEKKRPIYEAIASLDDTELHIFLVTLGQKMSDKAEFNLYGAHQINFESIQEITCRYETKGQFQDKSYTFELQSFVKDLQSSDPTVLKKVKSTFQIAQRHLPNIFNSYRFLDYLQSQIPKDSTQPIHAELRDKLKELREKASISTPTWLQEIERRKNGYQKEEESSLRKDGPKKE